MAQYGCPLIIYQLIDVNYCPVDVCNGHLLPILCESGTVGPVSGTRVHLGRPNLPFF